jgi:hypothetical protein
MDRLLRHIFKVFDAKVLIRVFIWNSFIAWCMSRGDS